MEPALSEPKIAGSSPVGGVFFFFFFFFFHPCIKNATYGFLSRSRTLKKTSIQYQKKTKSNQGLGLRHYFYCIPLLVITRQP